MPAPEKPWQVTNSSDMFESNVGDALSSRRKFLVFCHEQAAKTLHLNRYKVVKSGIIDHGVSAQAYIYCRECAPIGGKVCAVWRLKLMKRSPSVGTQEIGTETEAPHRWRMEIGRCGGDCSKDRVVRGTHVIQRRVSRSLAYCLPSQATTQHLLEGGDSSTLPHYSVLQADRKRWLARTYAEHNGNTGRLAADWMSYLASETRKARRIYDVQKPIGMTEWVGICFLSDCLSSRRVSDRAEAFPIRAHRLTVGGRNVYVYVTCLLNPIVILAVERCK